METRRERRERERQEQSAQQNRRRLGKTMGKLALWIGIPLVIVGGISAVIILDQRSPKPGEAITNDGRDHVTTLPDLSTYSSNPPTSGPHHPDPLPKGIYTTEQDDGRLIHSLEHGYVNIYYKDANDTALVEKLTSLVKEYDGRKVILAPRSKGDSAISVAAWMRLLKLEQFDEQQIRDFISEFIGRGPEPNAP
jgi:hypothetical protein